MLLTMAKTKDLGSEHQQRRQTQMQTASTHKKISAKTALSQTKPVLAGSARLRPLKQSISPKIVMGTAMTAVAPAWA